MPLMGSLYVGTSGLQASQNSLNTTGHNITNTDTTGYTRQQILYNTRRYNTLLKSTAKISNEQVGLGVQYSKTRAVRDVFLDKTYRKESGRSMFYQTSTDALDEVETLLGEFSGEEFSEGIANFWKSIQELVKDPTSSTIQGLFVQRASQLTERAKAVYDGMVDYQNKLNTTVTSLTETINSYGHQIATLNDQIVHIEVGGVETPNDLRDQRNLLLDELGKLVNMTYTENAQGYVSIQIEGTDFLKGDQVYEMGLATDGTTGFVTPYWKFGAKMRTDDEGKDYLDISNAKVFDLTNEISTAMNSDIGQLKAVLLARGDRHATYKDMEDLDTYNRDISQSVIMNVEAEFDQMMNRLTTTINDVLEGAGYQPLFMAVDATEGFTTTNTIVNPWYKDSPSNLGFMKPDDKADYETAAKLAEAFQDEKWTLNPNVATKVNFVQYYNSLVTQVANSGYVYNALTESQQNTVSSIEEARQQIAGVSTDEELQFMVMFQNAYNASSRYINVVDSMLEHLLNSMA